MRHIFLRADTSDFLHLGIILVALSCEDLVENAQSFGLTDHAVAEFLAKRLVVVILATLDAGLAKDLTGRCNRGRKKL